MGVVPVGSAARVARPARQGWVAAAAAEGGAAAATVVASVVTSAVGWRWKMWARCERGVGVAASSAVPPSSPQWPPIYAPAPANASPDFPPPKGAPPRVLPPPTGGGIRPR